MTISVPIPTDRINGPATQPLKPWKVIVHDDDVNTYSSVIEALVEIVRLDRQAAYVRTVEVDTQGLSVVTVTHKERAELIQEQLQSRTLTVSIELA